MSETNLTEKQKYWLEQIRRYETSNLSRKIFCKKYKLNAEHMSHFSSYLKKTRPDLFSKDQQEKFAAIKTTKQTIRLNLSNGVSMDVPASPRLIAEVIKALT